MIRKCANCGKVIAPTEDSYKVAEGVICCSIACVRKQVTK